MAIFFMIGLSALVLWATNSINSTKSSSFVSSQVSAAVADNFLPAGYYSEGSRLTQVLGALPKLPPPQLTVPFVTSALGSLSSPLFPVPIHTEDSLLKEELQNIINQYSTSRYKTHLYFFDPQNGRYVNIHGNDPVASASVIKLPILYEYLVLLEHRVLKDTATMLYAKHHQAGGSGGLQYSEPGRVMSIDTVARDMIRVSDNTCTNMMIEAMGGMNSLNAVWQAFGLDKTLLHEVLPDLEGTNTVSAYEMLAVLYNIDNGPHLSPDVRAYGLDILKQTHNRALLAWDMPKEVEIAHKTGNIGSALGDVAAFYLPDGRRYFLTMQVERPHNDNTPITLFRQISRQVYESMMTRPPLQTEESEGVLDEAVGLDAGY